MVAQQGEVGRSRADWMRRRRAAGSLGLERRARAVFQIGSQVVDYDVMVALDFDHTYDRALTPREDWVVELRMTADQAEHVLATLYPQATEERVAEALRRAGELGLNGGETWDYVHLHVMGDGIDLSGLTRGAS